MAENVLITPGVGDTVAADDIGGVKFQRVKIITGADGTNGGDVTTSNHFPVRAVPDRPSQGAGRTHVNAAAIGVETDTTLHTVTAGKTFYVTSAWICGNNDQTINTTRAEIQKNDGTKICLGVRLGVNVVGQVAARDSISLSFPEPFPYAAGDVVQLNIQSDGMFSAGIVGYEE